MDKTPPETPESQPADDWPDDDTMIRRGDRDPYLAEIARRSRSSADATARGSSSAALDWDGHERRSSDVDCFDPYVVELTRSIRSDF